MMRTSGAPLVVIKYNDKEVLNVEIREEECDREGWDTYWSRDVARIYFPSSYDTASGFYRPGKLTWRPRIIPQQKCWVS